MFIRRLYELAKDNEDQPAEAEEEGAMGYKNWLVCKIGQSSLYTSYVQT